MRWFHLIGVRAAVGLAIDAVALLNGESDWPVGSAAVICVASGVLGYWYARRLELKARELRRKHLLLVLMGSAPEAIVVTVAAIAAIISLPFEGSWGFSEGLTFVASWLAFMSPTVIVQATATWLWGRSVVPPRGGTTAPFAR